MEGLTTKKIHYRAITVCSTTSYYRLLPLSILEPGQISAAWIGLMSSLESRRYPHSHHPNCGRGVKPRGGSWGERLGRNCLSQEKYQPCLISRLLVLSKEQDSMGMGHMSGPRQIRIDD